MRARGSGLGREAVADARVGQDDLRARRIVLELAADVGDVDPQVVRLLAVARTPDLAQQRAVGEELAAVDGEHAQEVELDRREVHVLAVARDPARGEVDRDRAGPDDRIGAVGGIAPAQHGADAGRELVGAERLRHVVVGAGVERADLLALVADRAEHDDREGAPAAHLLADLDTAAVGQDEVEDHDVGRAHGDGVEGLPLRRGLRDLETRGAQDDPQAAEDLGLVVDDEDVRAALRHAGASGREAGRLTAKLAPCPSTGRCSSSRPPLASTNPRLIASPRPAPAPSPGPRAPRARPRKNGSKIASACAAATPGPSSVTRTVRWSRAEPPVTRTGRPGGDTRAALSRRLTKTRSSWLASARASGRSAGSSICTGAAFTCAAARPTTSCTSTQSTRGFTAPASTRERSSRSSTRCASRAVSSRSTARSSARSSPSMRSSASPETAVVMAVSGLRRSCEIACRTAVLATSARCAASLAAARSANRSRSLATSWIAASAGGGALGPPLARAGDGEDRRERGQDAGERVGIRRAVTRQVRPQAPVADRHGHGALVVARRRRGGSLEADRQPERAAEALGDRAELRVGARAAQ